MLHKQIMQRIYVIAREYYFYINKHLRVLAERNFKFCDV